MATYTPTALVPMAALTTSNATIYTATAVTGIIRTIHAQANTGSPSLTLALATDAAGTRLFDAYVLTANVPSIFNGWWIVVTSATVQAKGSATTVNLGLYGYTYA